MARATAPAVAAAESAGNADAVCLSPPCLSKMFLTLSKFRSFAATSIAHASDTRSEAAVRLLIDCAAVREDVGSSVVVVVVAAAISRSTKKKEEEQDDDAIIVIILSIGCCWFLER